MTTTTVHSVPPSSILGYAIAVVEQCGTLTYHGLTLTYTDRAGNVVLRGNHALALRDLIPNRRRVGIRAVRTALS